MARAYREAADFLTRSEAARLLDVTERTIFSRVRAGSLRPSCQLGRHGVRRSDVVALSGARGRASMFRTTARSAALLNRRAARLREDLQLAVEILDLRNQPLGLGEAELVKLYRCAGAFSADVWPPGSERTWIGILLRLDVPALQCIAQNTEDDAPWWPFYQLQAALARQADGAIALLLRAAEAHLLRLAVDWAETSIGPRAVQAGLRTLGWEPNRALVRRLQEQHRAKRVVLPNAR